MNNTELCDCVNDRAELECPFIATIPMVTVENVSGLTSLVDCFAHVSTINTTYYIDDKKRMTVAWSGPVEMDNYDYATNPLGLRSQVCYDFTNSRAIYFNKTGDYRLITLGV